VQFFAEREKGAKSMSARGGSLGNCQKPLIVSTQRIQRGFRVIDREDEESRLPERLRNLSITGTDDDLTSNRTAREAEESRGICQWYKDSS
jgi:hypothetical protein